jgi:hypothetical protein
MNQTISQTIQVERQISPSRLTELGVNGWPTWKDGVGTRQLDYDASEKSHIPPAKPVA